MKLTLKEMNGLLNGKCLPSDLIVGETLAEYLVRKFSEADAKCAALAAENAGLKTEHELALQYMDELRANFTMYKKFKCHSQSDVTTLATDSFLAEVRAQAKADGVQEYADSFRHSASKIRECHGDTIRVRELLHEASNADEFAAQLRKGVQS